MSSISSSGVRKNLGLVLCALLLAQYAGAATITVGASKGWNLGVDYRTWASRIRLRAGDSLYFKYNNRLHDVLIVSKADFMACNNKKPLARFNTGKDTIKFAKPGTFYVICGFPRHCTGGMKLAVTVRG
ncbi:hypothetical protein R1flu_002963 [Riccia fluitans]|uniref:Phytocyanin domain-containing protein n=1 Tax=Riccia fluitans TaxID=41844 RepID=A0ABD1Y7U4_9MARC